MAISKKHTDLQEIISYTPPQLYTGKEWYIGFMAFDPVLGTLHRKKIKLNHIQGLTLRRKYANELIKRLSDKLQKGWNPWIEAENEKSYHTFEEACLHYEKILTALEQKGDIECDTYVSYLSYLRNLKKYNQKQKVPITYIYQFNNEYIREFLEHVYIDRGNTAYTRDNYLAWLRVFASFLVEQQYHSQKPTEGITSLGKRKKKKQRTIIKNEELVRLSEFLNKRNKHYLLACYILYYCFIRPKEMSYIRLEHISLFNKTIFVPAANAKNDQDGVITLPTKVIELMLDLEIFKNPNEYYLFSNDFLPGQNHVDCKKFRDYWLKTVRSNLKFPSEYKFYSLKDSGITNLLRDKAIDRLSIRDQARHSSILITDLYTPHDIQEANVLIEQHKGIF